MPRQLFGTDGVRGRAGEFLTAELALALARAAVARSDQARPQVLIVRDTRESGEMLESAIAAGVTAAGGDALLAGVLPTPAAPLLVRRHGLDMAAVISASHNPYQDNGIKLFAADGFKLDDDTEHEIEAALGQPVVSDGRIGSVKRLHGALEDYLRELHTRFSELDLSGLRVLLDCAHGATFRAAPEIFRRLGAEVEVIAAAPDGRNINDGCGSTHLEAVVEQMRAGAHDIAFAFDGDGDRVLAVDGDANVVDGDELIALAAIHLHRHDRLPGRGRGGHGDDELRFPHGDGGRRGRGREHRRRRPVRARRVAQARVGARRRAVGPHHRSRLRALRRWDRQRAADARGAGRPRPARARRDGEAPAAAGQHPGPRSGLADARDRGARMVEAIEREGSELAGRGRVLVRASGTEPLIRVMVEAPTTAETDAVCDRLTRVVQGLLSSDASRV